MGIFEEKKHHQELVLIDPKICCQKETKLSDIILLNLKLVNQIENREPANKERGGDDDELS